MAPFSVLHVCMGNICRSPMAERLTLVAAGELAGPAATGLLYVHSVGTGGWHAGEPMNPPAARQVRTRGGDPVGFAARRLRGEHLDGSDLILTATGEQAEYVAGLRPDAAGRTFVLGEFGRLLARLEPAGLPASGTDPDAVYARGVALVAAVDAAREGRPSLPGDDLDDPWGRSDAYFARVADEIDATVRPLVAVLLDGR